MSDCSLKWLLSASAINGLSAYSLQRAWTLHSYSSRVALNQDEPCGTSGLELKHIMQFQHELLRRSVSPPHAMSDNFTSETSLSKDDTKGIVMFSV